MEGTSKVSFKATNSTRKKNLQILYHKEDEKRSNNV